MKKERASEGETERERGGGEGGRREGRRDYLIFYCPRRQVSLGRIISDIILHSCISAFPSVFHFVFFVLSSRCRFAFRENGIQNQENGIKIYIYIYL